MDPRSRSRGAVRPAGALAVLAVAVTASALYLFLVSYGSGDLFAEELRGKAYDSLASHLLHGSAAIDPDTIHWEGLTIDGKTYMYFGPFPALLRMPLNALFPGWYGKWSRGSCLGAALLTLAGVGIAAAMIVRQRHGDGRGIALLLAVSAAFCSPIVYLVSSGRLYHEAILWGLAGSAAALPAIAWLVFYDARSIAALFALSVTAAIALLSRITFALPLYAIVVLSSLRALRLARDDSRGSWLRVAGAVMPALLGGLFQLWYNYARFGSLFTALDYNFFYIKPEQFGGEFNLARIPGAFAGYFGISEDHFSAYPPYALVATPDYARPEIFFAWREGTFPLTLSATPLLLLAAWGTFLLFAQRQRPGLAVSLIFLGQVALISSYYFITARFAAEFLPLLFFLGLAAVRFGGGAWSAAVWALVPLSAFTTLASTLSWHMLYAKPGIDVPERWWYLLNRTLIVDPLPAAAVSAEDRYDVSLMPEVQIRGSSADVARGGTPDGGPLALFGRTFALGIGLQFGGSFTVTPPPGATRLVGVLALPDGTRSCFARDALLRVSTAAGVLFESARIRGNFDPTPIAIDLPPDAGPLTVSLVDTDERHECDFLNLLSLQFLVPSRAPESTAADLRAAVRLPTPSLMPASADQTNGGDDLERPALQLDGVTHARGFAIQAPNQVKFRLPNGARDVRARVGLPDGVRRCSLTDFELALAGGSGRIVYGPRRWTTGTASTDVILDVRGEEELQVRLVPAGPPTCDEIGIVEMEVTGAPSEPTE